MSIGERIKSARIMAGLSMHQLADKSDVSAMAISKYERNMDIPRSGVLLRMAKALNVKIEYFFRPTTITLLPMPRHKCQELLWSQEEMLSEYAQDWLERYNDIEELLNTSLTFQEIGHFIIHTSDDIENAALRLREIWHLGFDPIGNLVETCEDQGIKIGPLTSGESPEALLLYYTSSNQKTAPAILLQNALAGDAQRFWLAHQLGHLVMRVAEHIDQEVAANRFATAFLAPRPTVEFELGMKRHTISAYELHLLRRKYSLSIQSWICRAKDLSILSEETASRLLEQFRQQRRKYSESEKTLSTERPQRFERLVMLALSESIISQARAAELLKAPLSTVLGEGVEGDEEVSFDLCS